MEERKNEIQWASPSYRVRAMKSPPDAPVRPDRGVKRRPFQDAEEEPVPQSPARGISCFGGQLARDFDRFNRPIVRFSVEPSERDEEDGRYYARFDFSRRFLPFQDRIIERNRCVFTFRLEPDEKTVRECLHSGAERLDADDVLKQLVEAISEYDARKHSGQPYEPLRAISADTVFVNPAGRVRLLPLRACREAYPAGVLAEAGGVKTDLFSAVFLSVEIASGKLADESRQAVRLTRPTEQWKRDCLLMIPDWRPELAEVRAWLHSRREDVKKDVPVNSDVSDDEYEDGSEFFGLSSFLDGCRAFWNVFRRIPPFSWFIAALGRLESIGEPRAETDGTSYSDRGGGR